MKGYIKARASAFKSHSFLKLPTFAPPTHRVLINLTLSDLRWELLVANISQNALPRLIPLISNCCLDRKGCPPSRMCNVASVQMSSGLRITKDRAAQVWIETSFDTKLCVWMAHKSFIVQVWNDKPFLLLVTDSNFLKRNNGLWVNDVTMPRPRL